MAVTVRSLFGSLAIVVVICYIAHRPGQNREVIAPADEAPASKPVVHPEHLALIDKIRSTPGILWSAAANPRFAARAPGDFKRFGGLLGNKTADMNEAIQRGEVIEILANTSSSAEHLPESFQAEERWPQCRDIIRNVRDQSSCGCCWAFAAVGAASDRMCIRTGRQIPLSAQDACFNSGTVLSHGCHGGRLGTVLRFMQRSWMYPHRAHGIVSGSEVDGSGSFGSGWCSKYRFPHCHWGPRSEDHDDEYPEVGTSECPWHASPPGPAACDSDAHAAHSDFQADKYTLAGDIISVRGELAIQQQLMAGGPLEIAYSMYEDFMHYESGIYHHVAGDYVYGHVVKVVGWGVEEGVKYWSMVNSFNPAWGEQGFFRIRRGSNECGLEDLAVAASPTATWSRSGGFDAAGVAFTV